MFSTSAPQPLCGKQASLCLLVTLNGPRGACEPFGIQGGNRAPRPAMTVLRDAEPYLAPDFEPLK